MMGFRTGSASLASIFSLSLLFGINARPTARDVSLSSLVGDIVCPSGQSLFEAFNQGIVNQTSPREVWTYIGDFCNVTWQGFELVSTSGTCNTPESTRTFSTAGLTLSERLDLNIGSSSSPNPTENFFVQDFTLTGTPTLTDGVNVSEVHDLLEVVANDGGENAEILWHLIGCSNQPGNASTIFSTVHGEAVSGTIAHFT